MIKGNISKLDNYKNDTRLYAALVALKHFVNDEPYDKASVVSFNKMEGTTILPEEAKLENHRERTDIHYVISGMEEILVNDSTEPERLTEYSAEKDFELFALSGKETVVDLQAGDFLVVYPGESHAPKVAVKNKVTMLHKVIVKL